MNSRRMTLIASAALLAAGLTFGSAAAMPVGGLALAANELHPNVENVRWVCGPYRCWWRPGPYWVRPYWARPYPYGFYGRPYGYRFGWYGPRRHWW
jgi:hypothetical protein